MPPTHIALLRGINVGGAKRISMADLRTLVEGLGYRNVKTLLNSGNVVFTTRASTTNAAAAIEKALVADVGVAARVTVLTAAELSAIVEENSLLAVATHPSRLLVTVLRSAKDRDKLLPLAEQDWGTEALAIGTRAAYHWCAEGIIESAVAAALNKILGDAVTARNWATVLKLHALTAPSQ